MSPLPPAANGKIELGQRTGLGERPAGARKGERAGASCDEFTAVHRDPLIPCVGRIFCGEPASSPDQVGARLSPENAPASSRARRQILLQLVDRREPDLALWQLGFDRAVHEQRIGHAVDHAGLVDRRLGRCRSATGLAGLSGGGRLRRRRRHRSGGATRGSSGTRVSGARSTAAERLGLRRAAGGGARGGGRRRRARAAEPAEQRGPRGASGRRRRRAPDVAPGPRARPPRPAAAAGAGSRAVRRCGRALRTAAASPIRISPPTIATMPEVNSAPAPAHPPPAPRSGSTPRRRMPARSPTRKQYQIHPTRLPTCHIPGTRAAGQVFAR